MHDPPYERVNVTARVREGELLMDYSTFAEKILRANAAREAKRTGMLLL